MNESVKELFTDFNNFQVFTIVSSSSFFPILIAPRFFFPVEILWQHEILKSLVVVIGFLGIVSLIQNIFSSKLLFLLLKVNQHFISQTSIYCLDLISILELITKHFLCSPSFSSFLLTWALPLFFSLKYFMAHI